MTKQVILIEDASRDPSAEIISCLESAKIAVVSRSLDELEAARGQQWLAILYSIEPDHDLSTLRIVTTRVCQLFPTVPLVAYRQPRLRSPLSKHPRLTAADLKTVGFRAAVETPAQLPTVLRLLEDAPSTGDLKPLPEFDRRPNSAELSLPRATDDEQTRAAFVLTASLHLAKHQQEAGQIALAGLAQLLTADHWSIFLVMRGTGPDMIALQDFVNCPQVLPADPGENDLPASDASPKRSPSRVAHEAAVALERITSKENGRFVLAFPLVSEDILLGVLEVEREHSRFTDSEIALLERLTIPIAAALQNAVRISDAERLSHTDDLTQLHNARYLRQFLVNETKRARRYSSNLGAVFLDLDDFKQINDAHGHLVGSHVLMEVASLVLPSVRDTDCVVRYGGDEFVIILPETSPDEAIQVAERVRSKIESYRFSGGRRLKLQLTASFGVAVFPQHASSPQQLIAAADSAMYEAKANGKNCVRTSSGSRLRTPDGETTPVRTPLLKIPDKNLIS
jgi:diguanylate cyclase (GGDEF)-like protein